MRRRSGKCRAGLVPTGRQQALVKGFPWPENHGEQQQENTTLSLPSVVSTVSPSLQKLSVSSSVYENGIVRITGIPKPSAQAFQAANGWKNDSKKDLNYVRRKKIDKKPATVATGVNTCNQFHDGVVRWLWGENVRVRTTPRLVKDQKDCNFNDW